MIFETKRYMILMYLSNKNIIMKINHSILLIAVSLVLLISSSSCIILHPRENGGKRGWYKNSNNPHHPNTTNPGHSGSPGNSGKSKGRGHK